MKRISLSENPNRYESSIAPQITWSPVTLVAHAGRIEKRAVEFSDDEVSINITIRFTMETPM
jgi:hypothetical protein